MSAAKTNLTPLLWFWRDAATVNGLGINSLKDAIASGRLPSRRIRGRIMVRTADLEIYIASFPPGNDPAAKSSNLNRKKSAA